ncbi:hypothetical protein PSBY109024_01920 [Pseudoalteromonas byunsanensis]
MFFSHAPYHCDTLARGLYSRLERHDNASENNTRYLSNHVFHLVATRYLKTIRFVKLYGAFVLW